MNNLDDNIKGPVVILDHPSGSGHLRAGKQFVALPVLPHRKELPIFSIIGSAGSAETCIWGGVMGGKVLQSERDLSRVYEIQEKIRILNAKRTMPPPVLPVDQQGTANLNRHMS